MTVLALGPGEVDGLPAHVLLVHAAVLVVPAAALAAVASSVWPAARRRLGLATPLLALAALVCVPVTVQAGEWLAARVGPSPLVARHEELGQGLLPWVAALFAVAVLNHLWFRRNEAPAAAPPAGEPAPAQRSGGGSAPARTTATAPAGRHSGSGTATATRHRRTPTAGPTPSPARGGRPVATVVLATLLALVAATGSVVQVYRIGESGARAVWQGGFTTQPG